MVAVDPRALFLPENEVSSEKRGARKLENDSDEN